MLRWESVAPFGSPVVPLVNWMLTASVFFRLGWSAFRAETCSGLASGATPSKSIQPGRA